MNTPNPFRSLTDDWEHLGRSARARMAVRRWRQAEPALDGFDSPADIVDACQRRGAWRRSNVLLAALLRLAAGDALASRAVLQAVLPSLSNRAWRRRWDGSRSGPWETVEELDTELLAFALERIRELAGTSQQWPAQAILDVAYERFRWAAQVGRRQRVETVPLDAAHDPASPDAGELSDVDELLLGAVRSGTLRRRDAALIYATRVLGYTPAELAEREQRDVRAVRVQRARAERALAAAVM